MSFTSSVSLLYRLPPQDVYKRQVLTGEVKCSLEHTMIFPASHYVVSQEKINAVSYTHLDVYKRQPGTLIVESTCQKPDYTITGIAGKKGFVAVNIDKRCV